MVLTTKVGFSVAKLDVSRFQGIASHGKVICQWTDVKRPQ